MSGTPTPLSVLSTSVTKQTGDLIYSEVRRRRFLSFGQRTTMLYALERESGRGGGNASAAREDTSSHNRESNNLPWNLSILPFHTAVGYHRYGKRAVPSRSKPSNLRATKRDEATFSEVVRLIAASCEKAFQAVNTDLIGGVEERRCPQNEV